MTENEVRAVSITNAVVTKRGHCSCTLGSSASGPNESCIADGVVQTEWYAVVASAEFMLHDVQNEAFAEQLRERRRLLLERDTDVNFFLVSEPASLDELFADQAKQVRRPCVALISTDKQWIT